MITVTNRSARRRAYRTPGGTVWIESGETSDPLDAPTPNLNRRRAFARSGLYIREIPAAQPAAQPPSPPEPLPEPQPSDETALAGPPEPTGQAIEIPEDWRDMPWPVKRALAKSLTARAVHTKAGAEAVIEAAIEERKA